MPVLVSWWYYAIQSDVITHTSCFFVLCHGYQWGSIEKSGDGEPPICLFNGFWLLKRQLWQIYISICSIFQALQGAMIELFICEVVKKIFLTSLKPLISIGKVNKIKFHNFKTSCFSMKKESNSKNWTSSYSPTQEEFENLFHCKGFVSYGWLFTSHCIWSIFSCSL